MCDNEENTLQLTDTNLVDCPMCLPVVTLDHRHPQKILQHMGAHLLYDPRMKDRALEYCGMCLRPSPACSHVLKKGKGQKRGLTIDKKKSECLGRTNFSYRIASKSTDASPCSNVPLYCPVAGCPRVIWRYSLKTHISLSHPSTSPEEHRDSWDLKATEKLAMKKAWLARQNVPVKRAKKSDTPLVLSEAHRSILRSDRTGSRQHPPAPLAVPLASVSEAVEDEAETDAQHLGGDVVENGDQSGSAESEFPVDRSGCEPGDSWLGVSESESVGAGKRVSFEASNTDVGQGNNCSQLALVRVQLNGCKMILTLK